YPGKNHLQLKIKWWIPYPAQPPGMDIQCIYPNYPRIYPYPCPSLAAERKYKMVSEILKTTFQIVLSKSSSHEKKNKKKRCLYGPILTHSTYSATPQVRL